MEYQPFIINVPAGEGHQECCTIFQGRLLPRPAEEDRHFGITIDAGLISADQQDLINRLSMHDGKLNVSSRRQPAILLRHRTDGLLDGLAAADFLQSTFCNLHWIGLGPDRVVRYIPKRLFVKRFDYKTSHRKGIGLVLIAVEMNVDDIDVSLKTISEQWREKQEAHFGA